MIKYKDLKSKYKNFKGMNYKQKAEVLAFIFLGLFFIDLSFFGGGKYLNIYFITPRMLFAGLALFFSIPKIVTNFKQLIKNPIIILFIVFIVWLAISAIRGFVLDNRTDVLISDIKGYIWLFLIPLLIINVDSKRKLNYILTSVVVGATALSVFVLITNLLCVFAPSTISPLYNFWLDSKMGHLGVVSSSTIRVFFSSAPFVILTIVVVFLRQVFNKKISFPYMLSFILCLYAILVSYTRSLYGGAFIAIIATAVFLLVFYRSYIKSILKITLVSILAVAVFVFAIEFATKGSYFNFAISRTFGVECNTSVAVKLRSGIEELFDVDDGVVGESGGGQDTSNNESDNKTDMNNYLGRTEESDSVRELTVSELKGLIAQNPLFGNGLGTSVPSRESGLDEYFYLNTIAKIGVFGLCIYLSPFVYITVVLIKKSKKILCAPEIFGVLAGFSGLLFATYFNPWLNAVLGIAVYALYCSTLEIINKESVESEKFTEEKPLDKEEKKV